MAGIGYQEPLQLLKAQRIQACGQQQFWVLLARYWCPGATETSAVTGEQSLWAAGTLVEAS
jgi:hypothetical protein